MTQEEKQLLLVDLCARSPYGVKIKVRSNDIRTIGGVDMVEGIVHFVESDSISPFGVHIEHPTTFRQVVKPYLRPMSSMTEEEREHLQSLHDIISDENYGDGFSPAAWEAILEFNNYCREHHLDNGGLITLGLALEATEGMYK